MPRYSHKREETPHHGGQGVLSGVLWYVGLNTDMLINFLSVLRIYTHFGPCLPKNPYKSVKI